MRRRRRRVGNSGLLRTVRLWSIVVRWHPGAFVRIGVDRLRLGWSRWWWTGLVVLVLGAIAVVVPVVWDGSVVTKRGPVEVCRPDSSGSTSADLKVDVAVDGLAYPRATVALVVRIPETTPGAEHLLAPEGDPLRKTAMHCLLSTKGWLDEIRPAPPRVTRSGGYVELTDRVYTDLFYAASENAVGAVTVEASGTPWALVVQPPVGLRFARWDVAVSAPAGWLVDPTPWRTAVSEGAWVRWTDLVPDTPGGLVSVRLQPDTATEVLLGAGSLETGPVLWANTWLTALALIVFVVVVLRRRQFEPVAFRNARRAVAVVLVLTFVISLQWLSSALYDGFVVLPLLVAMAWGWWLPRTFVAGSTVAMLCGLLLSIDYESPHVRTWQVVSAYLFMFTLVMALGKAVHVLAGRGAPRSAPRWLWITSAAVALLLVLSPIAVALVEQDRRAWEGGVRSLGYLDLYASLFAQLIDDLPRLTPVLVALAVWHVCRDQWFEPGSARALSAATLLFLVGPFQPEFPVLGWWVPMWPVALLVVGGLVVFFRHARPSVLRRAGIGAELDLGKLRSRARRWYRKRGGGGSPSPVDVLLAAGPAGDPAGNMKVAVRLALVPSLVVGVGLTVAKSWTYPVLSVPSEVPVVGVVRVVAWAAVMWPLTAAALGLAWQHLPGRRGVTKVVPVIVLYALTPGALLAVTWTVGGLRDWVPIGEIAVFALFVLYLGLRMDRVALEAVQVADGGGNRVGRVLAAYGLENFSARFTALLTPAAAILALWSAFQGGDVSYPTVDPSQLPREVGQVEARVDPSGGVPHR